MIKYFLFLFVVLWSNGLFAHAEEPAAKSILKNGDAIIVQANFGIVSGDMKDYVCEESFIGGETWKMALLGENEWITFGSDAIKRTEDGCTFETVKEINSIVGDIRVSPDKKTIAYFANGGTDKGIWFSQDRGKSFTPSSFPIEGIQITGLRFSNNQTLLISAYDTTQEGNGILLSVSTQTLETTTIPLPEGVTFPYLLDANDEGYVWLGRKVEQTIFVGKGDKSDELEYIPGAWPTGAALSEDGKFIYVSGVNEGAGLSIGNRSTGSFELHHPDNIFDCLDRVNGKIYLCGLEKRDGFDVFQIQDDNTLKGVVKFSTIEGPKNTCSKDSEVGLVCAIIWKETASYFGRDPEDMRANDFGESKDTGVESDLNSPNAKESGCGAINANPNHAFLYFLFLGFFLVRRKART